MLLVVLRLVFGLSLLLGQADGILDKSISAILGAAGGMAVPSLILWHLLRSFIPDERKAFTTALSQIVAESAENRKEFHKSLKDVIDHCKEEIEAVDRRWQIFAERNRGGGS